MFIFWGNTTPDTVCRYYHSTFFTGAKKVNRKSQIGPYCRSAIQIESAPKIIRKPTFFLEPWIQFSILGNVGITRIKSEIWLFFSEFFPNSWKTRCLTLIPEFWFLVKIEQQKISNFFLMTALNSSNFCYSNTDPLLPIHTQEIPLHKKVAQVAPKPQLSLWKLYSCLFRFKGLLSWEQQLPDLVSGREINFYERQA